MTTYSLEFSLDPNTYERTLNLICDNDIPLSEDVAMRGHIVGCPIEGSSTLNNVEVICVFKTPQYLDWKKQADHNKWRFTREELKAISGYIDFAAHGEVKTIEVPFSKTVNIPAVIISIHLDLNTFSRFCDFFTITKVNSRLRITVEDGNPDGSLRGQPDDLVQNVKKTYAIAQVVLDTRN